VPQRRWSWLTFVAAAITSGVVAFAPTGSSVSCIATPTTAPVCTSSHESLLAHDGASVLTILAVPVVAALLLVVAKRRPGRFAVAIALTVMMLLGAMTIGVFFIPTVVLAWIAATRPTAHTRQSSQAP
jgi:hypothetical protein